MYASFWYHFTCPIAHFIVAQTCAIVPRCTPVFCEGVATLRFEVWGNIIIPVTLQFTVLYSKIKICFSHTNAIYDP